MPELLCRDIPVNSELPRKKRGRKPRPKPEGEATRPKRGRGRPTDTEQTLVWKGVGLIPRNWEYLKLWMTDEERAALMTDEAEANEETRERKRKAFGNAFARLFEFAQTFAPGGQAIEKPRDPVTGHFLPGGGTSKGAITRRNKREKKEREAGDI